MNFSKINNITGWIVCLIACSVYLLTMEATGSLWDCGEFIAASYRLQVPHPPGAPLFVLLGRLFSMWLPPDKAALGVNVMSALASGFTILFLFWTITYFARKLLVKAGAVMTREQGLLIIGAGVTGALAYTFSDSFWFSAVEGEVYAMSSLFTAIAFWAVLKWEQEADQPYADRWLILIAYIIGLSIGIHLLNLLTIPAIVMVYYFRRYKPTVKGTLLAFLLSCALTGIIQVGFIQYPAKAAGMLDVWFVNSLGLPFNSGALFFMALVVALLSWGIYRAYRRRQYYARLALLCIAFLFIGYSTYITTLIRSNANPGIDMFNVDNPVALQGYLGREQYGDFPLLYGQVFTAKPQEYKAAGNMYSKGKTQYDISGKRYEAVYDSKDMMLFPRIWDNSNELGHADAYRQWLGLAQGEQPTYRDNIKFFLGYQVNFMYLRYFMWNFVGRQNDIQGFGNVRDSNWVSGISLVDNLLYGDQSKLPDSLKENKAHNTLFFLPLVLGIMGLLYHYRQRRKDSLVVGLLFFFTGLAIVLYLNQTGAQPRERDYAYVGSFYAFAVWIGLGVLAVHTWLKKRTRWAFSAPVAVLACLLAVPVLMGYQEWDDHDRSQKVLARDMARDYLESCAPNAILFTIGDNETYPLWYAQEVEGIRPDVRVVHVSLLNGDWYIDQQRQRANKSAPVPMSWTPEQYRGDKRNYVMFHDAGIFPQDKFYNLKEVLQFMGSDDQRAQLLTTSGEYINFLPAQQVFLPVDKKQVIANGTVPASDSARVLPQMTFRLDKNALFKNDLVMLDMIATNNWERPVYFANPSIPRGIGLDNYLVREGLTYRLMPLAPERNDAGPLANDIPVNTGKMYDNVMHRFAFCSADVKGMYFDETNRNMLQQLRNTYTQLAIDLAAKGDKTRALHVLDTMDRNIREDNLPYAMTSPGNFHNINAMQVAYAYYLAGKPEKAENISQKIIRDCEQQIAYYQSLPPSKLSGDLQMDYQRAAEFIIPQLQKMKEAFREKGTLL
ncbi:glycosyltransferase family 117 protein [Chitinophaga japonensis]|uniref:Uncharacterized protein DUF2723 n=1 Tax=Chitinophaga japonensis TaxID=104662 RepID=A0A562T2S6_CHIJA|nr:DUF2723 domain-containing protein [Chitinophaga japonensis]TWI87927.1 uncharacterized protein DUF2723 [Chitinophaga japonensis]